jgi:hypothetical protein
LVNSVRLLLSSISFWTEMRRLLMPSASGSMLQVDTLISRGEWFLYYLRFACFLGLIWINFMLLLR